jgi:hypothetical protein
MRGQGAPCLHYKCINKRPNTIRRTRWRLISAASSDLIGTCLDSQTPSKLMSVATAVAASAVSKVIWGSRSAG